MKKRVNDDDLVILSDYIDRINHKNEETDDQDIRLNFFYAKKAKKLLMARKMVSCAPNIPSSRTCFFELDHPFIEKYNFEDKKVIKDFVTSEDEYIGIDPNSVARMDYSEFRDAQFLELLKVQNTHRNFGLASKLIDEIKSASINNGFYKITGDIVPLDIKSFVNFEKKKDTPLFDGIINHLALKSGILKDKSYTDFKHLLQIYDRLGFEITDNKYELGYKKLSMDVDKDKMNQDNLFPESYTSHYKNYETVILFK